MDVKTFSLTIIFCYAILLTSFGQSNESLMTAKLPQSPEAASLAKFIEIPVSYFNGVPEITIPLYEITEGDIKVPITIGYHSSGIKTSEESSWVGLGWALSAGGEIIVDIKGKYDWGNLGYLNASIPLPDGNSTFEGAMNQVLYPSDGDCFMNTESGYASYCGDATEQYSEMAMDGEPDLYMFNFCSAGGKFIFKRTLVPGQSLPSFQSEVFDRQKIKFEYASTNQGLGLKATTTDGTKYYFQEAERSRPSVPPTTGGNGQQITSFKLTKIESGLHPQNSVTFSYYTVPNEILQSPNISYSKSTRPYGQHDDFGTTSYTLLESHLLDKITFSNGYVKFYRSPRLDLANAYKLDSISVVRTVGDVKLKTFIFSYDYFLGDPAFGDYYSQGPFSVDNRSKRLKLNSLLVKNAAVREAPYVFNYNSQALPYKTSRAVDFWGYFNGVKNNATLLPTGSDLEFYYAIPNDFLYFKGANRKPDNTYMQAGVLTSVKYPTGGVTTFNYEANRFLNLRTVMQPQFIYADVFNAPGSGVSDIPISQEVTFAATTRVSIDVLLGARNSEFTCPPSGRYSVAVQQWNGVTWNASIDNVWDLCGSTGVLDQGNGNILLTFNGNQKDLAPGRYRVVANYPSTHLGDPGVLGSSITLNYFGPSTNTQPVLGGGLRVSQITEDPVNGPLVTRTFTYTAGINLSMPIFTTTYESSGSVAPCSQQSCNPISNQDGSTQLQNLGNGFYSNMLVNYSNSANGSYVGYSSVAIDYAGTGKGRTLYNYQIQADNFNFVPNTFPGIPSANQLDNGKLLAQTDYKYDAATQVYIPLRKTTNTYEIQDKILTWGTKPQFIVPYFSSLTSAPLPSECLTCHSILYDIYPIRLGRAALISTTEQLFDIVNNTNINTFKQFTYNNAGFPAQTTYTDSKGLQIITQNTYSNDYTGVTTGWISELQTRNMIQFPIESINQVSGSVVNGSFTEYSLHDNIVTPSKSYHINSAVPISGFSLSTPNNVKYSAYVLEDIYTFDSFGNITESQKVNDLKTSLFWGYNNTLPLAKVINANAQDIFYTSFEESGGTPDSNCKTGTNIGTTPYAKNLTTLSNGNYELSYWQRNSGTWSLVTIPVSIANSTTGSNGSYPINLAASVTTPIDDIRFKPVGVQMTTYTYDPLVGPTSFSDPNGVSNYYEYDLLGRLKVVKDFNNDILKTYDYNYRGE